VFYFECYMKLLEVGSHLEGRVRQEEATLCLIRRCEQARGELFT
jgi:hypothetical protein